MVVMDGRTKFHEIWACMMTSSNGNIFRVTGPLCGKFTGPGEFPAQRPVTRSFGVYFDLRLNKRLSKQSWGWWFETLSRSLWRHRNVMRFRWISYMATAPWVRFLPIDEQGSHQRRYIQCGAAITRSIFSKIITKYPIARLSGRGMGCLLWVQTLIYILAQSPQWCVQYIGPRCYGTRLYVISYHIDWDLAQP